MLLTDPNFSPYLYHYYSLVQSDWYESFSQFIPAPDFLSVARDVLPLSWSLHPAGVWLHTSPPDSSPDHQSPKQGWKIHISARPETSKQILEKSARLCVHHEAAFKFLVDPFVFDTIMNKGGVRESGGKFITIYPLDIQHFRAVADDLCDNLAEFKGPYILSDKRYKNSQVVYYRYGAFTGHRQI